MKYVFFHPDLTQARAAELVKELGFLGICDLVHVLAEDMDGSIELKGHGIQITIKNRKARERAFEKWKRGKV